MMRKWLMMLIAAVLLLTGTACAQEANRDALLDAAVTVVDWQAKASDVAEELQDEDAAVVLAVMDDTLTVVSSVLMDASQPGNDFTGQLGDMFGQEPYAVSGSYGSGTRWVSDLGVYCDVLMTCDDNYLCAELAMYDKDGMLLGLQRVEYGTRDGRFMALLVDFDQSQWVTGRFALYPEGGSGRVIFTKTLGQTLDVMLDVRAWTQGEDMGEWSKELLLPDGVMDQ